ncbi:flippase [Chryseobacterium piscium]|uniref:Flippase n=1 Tax=Chryseobacterium piscium TaxID=333702 RepID=A0A3D9B1V0_9FLAO|nr:flippase [Chryseobacterium piscium]
MLNHSLFKSSLIYTLCDALNKSVPFFILPILSYYLLPSDYGIIANFGVVLSIVCIFIMIGVDGAMGVQFFKLSKEQLAKYNFNAFILICCITILSIIFFLLFHNKVYEWVKLPLPYQLLISIMAFTTTITALNLSLWRLEEQPFKFGIYEISQTIFNIGISLILVIIYNQGWVGRVSGMFLASVAFGLYSLILLFKRGYLKINFNITYLKHALFFGAPLIPHALSFWVRSSIDRVYITQFEGESATGLYATGFQFGLLISFITLSFNNAFVPYLFKKLGEKKTSKYIETKEKLVKLTYIIAFGLIILAVIFSLFSYFALDVLFSDNYVNAKKFIVWAIAAQTFQGFYLLFVNYIFYANKTRFLAIITFGCSCIQLILSYILIRNFGAIGGAYSTVIVSFVNFIAVALYSNKVFPMPWLNFLFIRN